MRKISEPNGFSLALVILTCTVHGRNNKYVNVNRFSKRIRNKSNLQQLIKYYANFITSGDASNRDSLIEFDLCFARSVDSVEGNTNGFMIGDSNWPKR